MINLDTVIKPEKSEVVDYSIPVPEGNYICKVLEIKPWKAKTLVKVVNPKTQEVSADVTVYNATAVLEIIEGEHKGRRLFYNLTTHPNMPWVIPNFLYATRTDQCSLNELTTACVGGTLEASVKIEEREIIREDRETGIPIPRMEKLNSVRSVKQPSVTHATKESVSSEFDV